MSGVPDNLQYTKEHEWLRQESDGSVVVGITDHAQHQLGELVFIELPEPSRAVTAGEACAVVESVKAASDVYAPVSGTVVAVNDALVKDPGLVNTSPYEQGWLFQVKPSAAPAGLMDAAAYRQLLDAEG